jgi:hypothetical protein
MVTCLSGVCVCVCVCVSVRCVWSIPMLFLLHCRMFMFLL